MAAVLIRGAGVAGSCCSRLLGEAGLHVSVERLRRPKLPAIMLGEMTQKLLLDVFGREDLLAGLPRISRRVVAWGRGCESLTLPHSAVVVSEQELLDRIQQGLAQSEPMKCEDPDWTILASAPLGPSSVEHHVGSRLAAASPVKLRAGCDAETCWIESLESGWLFLLPNGKGTGWLLSVGGSAESDLEPSRLIKDQIVELGRSQGTFASHPRIALPLSEPGWLACGAAALGFDPLCGDGTGNATREAILGSAVVRAAIDGGDVDSLVACYHARLLAGFKRHLSLCFDFYRSGRSGPWWDNQLAELERGLAWCSQQFTDRPAFRYRLNGFTLETD
jgi:flavin-dependent dehydrogenase